LARFGRPGGRRTRIYHAFAGDATPLRRKVSGNFRVL